MKRLILFLFSLFFFSSCSLSSSLFKGDLISGRDMSQIKAPELSITKSKITMKLQSGISFVSFPFLGVDDAAQIQKNPNIQRIWQENDVTTIEKNQSYFIETNDATELSWDKSEEESYSSSFIQAGKNFPAIFRGSDQLLLSQIKLNGQSVVEAFSSEYKPATHFYIFGQDLLLHDLANESLQDIPLLLGGGIMIESLAFSKISWPLSGVMQKQFDSEVAKVQKQADQLKNKAEKEQQKYEGQVQKTFEKIGAELSKKVFDETKDLPTSLLKSLLSQDQQTLTTLFANRQLLAQVHEYKDIESSINALDPSYWEQKKEYFRPFSILTGEGFTTVNTVNRSIVFLEFPYNETELSNKNGALAFYRGVVFIRTKDCNWQFDPIETLKTEKILSEKTNLYDAKHLKKLIDNKELLVTEPEEFSSARNSCKPAIKGVLDAQKGKLITLSDSGVVSNSKLLKHHEADCQKFATALQKLAPEKLQETVTDSSDEVKIETAPFPNISFDENVCLQVWPQILERQDLLDILNDKDGADQNIKNMIIDDALITFLGANSAFNCSKLEEDSKKDICYFGNAFIKSSISSCKKIQSKGLQFYCGSAVAMAKKDPKQCEKVWGIYNADQDSIEKKISIRNCELDAVIANAKTISDCKQFKKQFLFFFHVSTPSFDLCESYVSKEKKLSFWTSKFDEEGLLQEMGIDNSQKISGENLTK